MSDYLEIATALYTFFSIATRMTPTKSDDKFMGKIGQIWSFIFEATKKR